MRPITLTLVFLMACLAVGWRALVVYAHADYERSEPAAGAVLQAAPEQIQVWFTEELFRREQENRVEVYGPDGERVDLDDATIDDDDRTLMRVSLPPNLPDGVYTVRWRTLSAEDGHPGDGEFTFTVGEAVVTPEVTSSPAADEHDDHETAASATPEPVAETPTSAPLATSPPAQEAPSSLPCLGGIQLTLLALGAVWVGRRRKEQR